MTDCHKNSISKTNDALEFSNNEPHKKSQDAREYDSDSPIASNDVRGEKSQVDQWPEEVHEQVPSIQGGIPCPNCQELRDRIMDLEEQVEYLEARDQARQEDQEFHRGLPSYDDHPEIYHPIDFELCFKLRGGLRGKVLYIDTENTFKPERIVSIAKARGFDPNEALKNITVETSSDSLALRHIIEKETPRFLEKTKDSKLLVVDSIISQHRAEYKGRGNLAARQQDLNAIMNALSRIARRHDIAVLITNHMISSPDPNSSANHNTVAAGGHVLAHASTYRIYIKKSGYNRIARMEDSPCHPTREVLFTLTEKGVDDLPGLRERGLR